jgi:hypothetical protein
MHTIVIRFLVGYCLGYVIGYTLVTILLSHSY